MDPKQPNDAEQEQRRARNTEARHAKVSKEHERQAKAYRLAATERIADVYDEWAGIHDVQSPAEMIFLHWWHAVSWFEGRELQLWCQRPIEAFGRRYVLDFTVEHRETWLLKLAPGAWKPIVIEVDGHKFHERTPEQVRWRDQRDRDLQALGYRLFHFSYSELVGNPHACVIEVISAAKDHFSAVRAAIEARCT